MESVIRKGIAFDPKQLKDFDTLIRKKGYKNRSEAIRDLLRDSLIKEKSVIPDKVMMATLTIQYDHHSHDVQHELTHIQHHAPELIISSLHTHIDEHNCLEVLILKGKVKEIKRLSDSIIATKGVQHGELVLTSG
jgi:CopG family transcriptional regulator, nickel-responsive regulator